MWTAFEGLEDPELKRLATDLPATVLRCKATSTTKKYTGAYRRWREWASKHKLTVFPANEAHVALYLRHLADTKCSKSAVEEAAYALAWAHSMAGITSPTESPLVSATLGGLKRELAKPVVKKSPFTARMLQAIAQDARKRNTLASLRLGAACLLSFAGFLRFDELSNINVCDITVGSEFLTLRIPRSKTDQLRQGDEVIIARSGLDTCPVAMLEAYMQKGDIQSGSSQRLFRAIVSGKVVKLRASGGLSHTRMAELLDEKLQELGFHAKDFTPHSLRSGGATTAANAGVPDRLFKKHGRWKSENAKDGYIEDSLEQRLSVTKSLGI